MAETGPLIAMKLQSVMNRSAAKEGTDLLDVVRIVLDPECGSVAFTQLESADGQLRADALRHVHRWFDQYARQSLGKIRAVPEGQDVEAEDLVLVGDVLAAALGS